MPRIKAVETIQLLAKFGAESPKSLYSERLQRNIHGKGRRRTVDHAWDGLLIGILTTQQQSTGKHNLVRDLLNSGTLTWEIASNDPCSIDRVVNGFNYNRRKRTYLLSARKWLQNNVEMVGEHRRAINRIHVNNVEEQYTAEVSAANCLRKEISGLGPKQSRNFWQYLGYSAWTISL